MIRRTSTFHVCGLWCTIECRKWKIYCVRTKLLSSKYIYIYNFSFYVLILHVLRELYIAVKILYCTSAFQMFTPIRVYRVCLNSFDKQFWRGCIVSVRCIGEIACEKIDAPQRSFDVYLFYSFRSLASKHTYLRAAKFDVDKVFLL